MAEPSLAGCFEKVKRAKEHLDLLREEAYAFTTSHSYEQLHHFNRKTKRYTVRLSIPAGPPRLGVLAGDVAHNLRSALDHLVWQLVLANGSVPVPGTGGNQFPILTTKPKGGFRLKQKRGKLKGVHPVAIRAIEELQPYRFGPHRHKHALAILQRISNADKHQLVHATRVWVSDKEPPELNLELNADAGALASRPRYTVGPLADETELVSFRLTAPGPEPHVDVEGEFTLKVALEDGTVVADSLDEIVRMVGRNMRAFEKHFF